MGLSHRYDADQDEPFWDYPDPPESGEWPACAECGDPTDGEEGGPHAACGTFYCPGECGAVVRVPALACPRCAAWVAEEDEAERRENQETS